jgi:hypothetical protein
MQAEGKIDSKELLIKCSISGKAFTNKFAIGERIRLTKNDYSKNLSNGDLGNLVDIQSNVDGSYNFKVKLDNGNKVTINTDEYCNDDGHLYMTQAYAMTVYSSQGLTIDGDVFVYCSRQKDNSHLFINHKEIEEVNNIPPIDYLSKLMSLDNKNLLAIEHLDHSKKNFRTLEI